MDSRAVSWFSEGLGGMVYGVQTAQNKGRLREAVSNTVVGRPRCSVEDVDAA